MGLIRQLALIVLAISLLTAIALFGQLPSFRKTPVGFLHRLLRHKLPAFLSVIDQKITTGTLTPLLLRCGNYIINEKHPLVIVFYLTLVTGGSYLFVYSGWDFLSGARRALVVVVIPLPYISLYLATYSDPGIITPGNHRSALKMYPYDCINFFPPPKTPPCRTCYLQKPARSKHCIICRACVAKHDHHCVWINNCVGVKNVRYFLFFLAATDLLLAAGTTLSYGILVTVLQRGGVDVHALRGWGEWATFMSAAFVAQIHIGAVFLLSMLCGILGYSFTAYHLYLIWAGTTTNETFKWADWRDDIRSGLVFKAEMEELAQGPDGEMPQDECKTWPRRPTQCLCRVEARRTPRPSPGLLWHRVESLSEVDNLYDLGGWANFLDVVFPAKMD